MKVTESVIVNAFDVMGGDSSAAASAAKNFSSVGSWVTWQATQTAMVGAAAMAVPGAHVPALVVDVAFLMHKLAYCSWGVGSVLGCTPYGKADFEIILGHWCGAIEDDVLPAAIATSIAGGSLAAVIALQGTSVVIGQLAGKSVELAATMLLEKVGAKGSAKAVGKVLGKVTGKVAGKLSDKIAAKLVTKFGGKLSGKALSGFIPFVGPIVGGSINIIFVRSIAHSAEKYYRERKKFDQHLP